jgi:FKBP-type peptidyl-prolyl cis-trans isomerase FklB
MKNLRNAALILLAAMAFQACNKSSYQSEKINTKADSASYMLGLSVGYSLKASKVPDINAALIAKGINEVAKNDSASISQNEVNMFLDKYFRELHNQQMQKNKEEGEAFLKANKTKPGVIETASGLQYKVIQEGTGKSPKPTDVVKCNYTGKLIDGTIFDSSYDRGQPAEFSLSGVIPGWKEGLQLMKEGGKYELYVPSDLAYGARGAGQKIGPNSTLIFDIELLEVKPADDKGNAKAPGK